MKAVVLPKSLTGIGCCPFEKCAKLETVEISLAAYDKAFFECARHQPINLDCVASIVKDVF